MEFKTYSQTLSFLTSYVSAIEETSQKDLASALDFILAEDVKASVNLPLFNNSAMDGWAFSGKEIKAAGFALTEVGTSFAGHPYSGCLRRGECVRIMTGGEVPEGADTVVKQEIVRAEDKLISFPSGISAGENVRRKGEELKVGQICLSKGTLLRAPHLNYLAAVGVSQVKVFRKIKVGFFSTGDELQAIDRPLVPGKIYDSNRYCIQAMLREKGFEAIDYGVIKDNPEALKTCLSKAAEECDAIITSGGVSVGEADFTRQVMLSLGELVPWHCLIKPGKPLAIGKIGNTLFFGLPGNPTAAQVTFYAIVAIALRLLAGEKDPKLTYAMAYAKGKFKKALGYTDFQRGILEFEEGKVTVRAAGSQKTGVLSSMISANCFIQFADDKQAPTEGELIPVVPFAGVCF